MSCDVQFANGTRVAEYTVAAPAAGDGGGTTPGCSEDDSTVPCVVVSGPAPTSPLHCHRTACELSLYFTDAEAHAVANYLGTEEMVDFTLTCGGFVLKHETTYFVRGVCPV